MVAKIDLISEASHKHAKEVTALCFDGEHLYSASLDGIINVWDKNLKFTRENPTHKDYAVISMALTDQKQLYTTGRDGTLRFFRRPWSHDTNDILLQTAMDDVTSLFVYDHTLYSGDDKGIVTRWYHNQVGGQYNVMEEVKSMAVEGTNLYTVRESDVVITEIKPQHAHVTIGTIPGRYPLILFGKEVIKDANAPVRRGSYITAEMNRRGSNVSEIDAAHLRHKYIISASRDGKGFTISNNEAPFKEIATKADAHTMIITAMCELDDFLITAGFDGKVKKWKNLDQQPSVVEEINTGKCINVLCPGPDHTIFVGDSEGLIKRLRFTA